MYSDYVASEVQFINQVNADLRKHDNILIANPDNQKLQLGRYVCEELKTKSILVLNLETYRLIVKVDEPRFTRYMQWYEAISGNAVRCLCNNKTIF
jgi:hypothetical protein